MIPIYGLAHVGIRVARFEPAVSFYQQLGFEVVREDYVDRVVVLKHASGVELNLLDSADAEGHGHNVLMDADVRYPGYTHIALRVGSITDTKRWLEQRAIAITEGPVRFGDGSTSLFIRDADRNVIEFSQPRSA